MNFSLLGYEAGCEFPQLMPTYIDNLCRLGLADIPTFFEYTAQGVYDVLERRPEIVSLKQSLEANDKWNVTIQRRGLRITELGKQFCQVCVVSHDQKGLPKKGES